MPNYRLTYFNGRGRGETTRLCFAAAGIPYEDYRIEKPDWNALKPGLAGQSAFEQSQVDSVVDAVTDLREKGIALKWVPEGPAKEAAVKTFHDTTLPAMLPNLERFAASNPSHSGHFVGSKMTLADIHFYAVIESLMPSMPHVLKGYPALTGVCDRVHTHPRIAEYLKHRPHTAL